MGNAINKYFFSFLLLLVSCFALAQTKSTNVQSINGSSYYIHKIEKGQSLYAISKLYNVSLDEIYANNPDTKSGTKANQEIKIPVKNAVAVTHSVAVNTNTAAAKTSSPISNPAIVTAKANTLSSVPTVTTALTSQPIDTNLFYTYKVAKKETFYSISKKFNLSESELKIFNPELINKGLKDGQLIIVGEKKQKIKTPVVVKQTYTHADSVNPNVIHRNKKSNYNVSLILPFRLDETNNLDLSLLAKNKTSFPAVPALAIDFYLGFKSAVDSLNSKDFELSIDLYDIDDKDSLKLAQLVNDEKFKQSDFIFGPLHANGFKSIAQKAKESGIPIVSPVTQMNKILYENVYVSKTNPSQFTLLESLADFCIDSLINNGAKIILVTPTGRDIKEESYIKAFKKYYNDKQIAIGKTLKDSVTVVKGLEGVKKTYVPNVKNVIVTLSNNQVFIADFTTQLAIYADKKDITLCGWQSLSGLDNIDQEYLNQLNFTFPTQYNLTNTANYAPMIESYKSQQNSYPGEYYFMGYDIAMYYLKNLKEKGPDFIFELNRLPQETNYMRFKFSRPDNLTGFDNRGVYIFKYKDYQLYKTGWK